MTGLELVPRPPALNPTCSARSSPRCSRDGGHADLALVLDSELYGLGRALLDLVPAAARPPGGVDGLLAPLGLADVAA